MFGRLDAVAEILRPLVILALDRPPTAILCNNDRRAMLVLDVLRARGVRVPRDVSVVGFDNLKASAKSRPPLTTVDGRPREVGEAAVKYVLGRVAGRKVKRPEVSPRLVVRESAGPVA